MSELRYNRLKDTWTIIAEERAKRPHDYKEYTKEEATQIENCPFEYGNEHMTPPEVFAIREKNTKPNSSGWKVRVVPNKYPAVSPQTPLDYFFRCIYDNVTGFGYHEVIIDTPDHFKQIQDFNKEDFQYLFTAFKERLKALSNDNRIKYIHIFKNHRKEAGKSLYHSHSQLIALPMIPKLVDTQINQSRSYYKQKERCLLCDEVMYELETEERILYKNEKFVVYCPYASLYPFEIRIVPYPHSYSFLEIKKFDYLIDAVKVAVKKLNNTLLDPPFNLILYTSPPKRDNYKIPDYFYNIEIFNHWYIEILPRITTHAGFELGTGYYINPVPPETAVNKLKQE
ncbi:MAG: galactose-1-phosphate uridylyltransferase [Aquificae bacterium]|nr:galactose-1-phosphate uridylyltransferase [Aquificota bacterium]